MKKSFIPRQAGGFLLLGMAVAAWGVCIPLNKLLLQDAEPLITLILQLAGSVALLSVTALLLRLKFSWKADRIPLVVMIGVLEPMLAYYLGFLGVQHTSATHTSVIFALEPVGIVVFNAVLFGRHTVWPVTVAILVSIAGVALIAADGYGVPGSNVLLGDSLVVAGVMAAALYVSLSNHFGNTTHLVKLLLLQQAASLVFLGLLQLLVWTMGNAPWKSVSLASAVGTSATGILQFGLSFLCYFWGVRKVTGSTSVLALNLIPVAGVASSIVLLGESPSPNFIIGAAIIVSCMIYTSCKENH